MNFQPLDSPAEEMRSRALAAAIELRECSLRAHTSHPTQRACRTVMREQAFKWRQPPASNHGGARSR